MAGDDGIVGRLRAKAWQSSRPLKGKFHETHICWQAADRIEKLEGALRNAEASIMLIVGKEPDGSEHPITSNPYKTAAKAVEMIRATLTKKDDRG